MKDIAKKVFGPNNPLMDQEGTGKSSDYQTPNRSRLLSIQFGQEMRAMGTHRERGSSCLERMTIYKEQAERC